MPELPDLQVIGGNLNKKFKNKRIKEFEIHNHKKLNASKEEYEQRIQGKVVDSIYREGKELLILLKDNNYFTLHLMLKGQLKFLENESTGQLSLLETSQKDEIKHKIVKIVFEDDNALVLTDFMGQAKATLNPEIPKVPDALSEDFDGEYLYKKSQENKKSNVKNFLKNQEIVRGIGNAYVDEILWEARIAPQSIVSKTPKDKIDDIVKHSKMVLENAIEEIKKAEPELISGELRHFLKIHTSKRKYSPTGFEIKFIKMNSKKTYFTDEQELYE